MPFADLLRDCVDRLKGRGRRKNALLMAEMAAAGEDHGGADRVGRADDLGVTPRPARLDERRDALVEGDLRAVREREERVAREYRALQVVPQLARLLDRDAHGVHA